MGRALPDTQHAALKQCAPIFIVDDDPDACAILRLFLTAEGFNVITAQSVVAALSCMRDHLPSLIITDYNMPGATGQDLCRDVRSHPRTRAIPIILHTCCDLSHIDDSLYDQVFEKPTDLNKLSHAIRRLLEISQSATELANYGAQPQRPTGTELTRSAPSAP